ncbi:hypothetical protein BJ973_001593 [Actinoplanes tereljensis]|uniref:Uncharacterized protein n=1 Tax=Paractinoplanes tereljensis TaxID=571912 RepID=A0A919NLQ8_9ACTN|nr:hypothetical protein [Actinoplanes tereljensis]GIF20503.1 hypothetical protein Ate02nite_32330 [Actinoplanes tereljensis]
MGIDAYVHCGCWRDGLATPPAVGPVGFDEYGRLGLLAEWTRDTAEAHGEVEHWLSTGCAHEDMTVAREHLGSGTRHLARALREAGLPVLLRRLPVTNDGFIPAEEVPQVLAELEVFESEARLPDEIVLVVEAGDTVLGDGRFTGPRYRGGTDEDGFFVLDAREDPPVTVFRATRFEQRALPGGELELTGENGTVRLAGMTPFASFLPTTPRWLAVEVRTRSGADFAHVLGMLRRLCAASLTTGSPVTWT